VRCWKCISAWRMGRLLVALALVLLASQARSGPRLDSNQAHPDPSRPQSASGENHLRFVVYGDTRDGHAVHRRLVRLILAQKPDLVLQTGDLVHDGSYKRLWRIYDDITGSMRRRIPVYPSRGNHDLGGPGYEARVPAPLSSGNRLYYAFDRANCHFISLDCFSPFTPGSPQYRWLTGDLASAQKYARHIFVFFHCPPYSIGPHGSDTVVQRVLCPLFIRYGVRAVFNGHDHLYYRTLRNGVLYVVSGGGGAPLYPAFPSRGALKGDKWASAHHIVVCDVSGNKVHVTALRADGARLDSFTVSAP